ncbi:MAG TPA: hypothetical protein VK158_01315 [Acidobacteriota bacterium]|nr:hypothetical protein [Acidobacteriota bacterium]
MNITGKKEQKKIVETNLAILLIQIERFERPGRVVVVTDIQMPVQLELMSLLSHNQIYNASVVSEPKLLDFLVRNPTDVVVLPASLSTNSAQSLWKSAQLIDPTISFISYSKDELLPEGERYVGFEHIKHYFMDDEAKTLLIKGIKTASRRTYAKRRSLANRWFLPIMERFITEQSNKETFSAVYAPHLPILVSDTDARHLALQYERYATIESALVDNSQEGIRRLRFLKSNPQDILSKKMVTFGIKKMQDQEYFDALALQKYLREVHPDLAARYSIWLLSAKHENSRYVAFSLFQSMDLSDCFSILSKTKSAQGPIIIDSILKENLHTLVRLQRPLPSHDIQTTVANIKQDYVKKTSTALEHLMQHSPHRIPTEERRALLRSLDSFSWLMPESITQKDAFAQLGFSILADNSPKNSGLEFSKKPSGPRKLLAYFATNGFQSMERDEIIRAKVARVYRVYEATSRKGHRLEDVVHILSSNGLMLTEQSYAGYRNLFLGNLMQQQDISMIPDAWYGALLASGPGIGWYKSLRKQHLISSQYLDKVRLRFLHGEITGDELNKKVEEYVDLRQMWANRAGFFVRHWQSVKDGTAMYIEAQKTPPSQHPAVVIPTKRAYKIASEMLANVDIARIASFTERYFVSQPNFIPYPQSNSGRLAEWE